MKCKLTNSEPHLSSEVYAPQEAIFLCLNHSRASDEKTRDHPMAPSPLKSLKLANPKGFTLPCPVLPLLQRPQKRLLACALASLLLPFLTKSNPSWRAMPLVSRGTVNNIQLSLQWQRPLNHLYKLRPRHKTAQQEESSKVCLFHLPRSSKAEMTLRQLASFL